MPTLAFVFLLAGVLLIYGELIWIGKFVFGITGAILVVLSISMLWRIPPTPLSAALIGLAIFGFLLEAAFETRYAAGGTASLLLAWGFWRYPLHGLLTVPSSLVFGAITTWLLAIAKQARKNKYSDI